MKKFLQYYQIFCNLSMDVIIGIVCCMLPLPEVFHVIVPWSWYVLLPLSAWIIYLSDHLLDVKRKKISYPTPRHRFIRKYFKPIVFFIILLSVTDLGIAFLFFDQTIFITGIVLGIIVLVHFILVAINPQKKFILNNKELAIAFIYAAGIYAVPLQNSYHRHDEILVPVFCSVLFLLIVFLNLMLASIIEYEYDVKMENSSFVRVVSPENAYTIFLALTLVIIISGALLILQSGAAIGYLVICYQAMAIGHYLIYLYREKLEDYLAYRKLSELLFWLPAIVYLIAR
ncbi:MAG: hypothetical protein ACHQK8_02455 [Bacteroidia bacterium]